MNKGTFDPDPNKWLDAAESVPGSWWPTWNEWLVPTSGEKVAAPEALGNDKYTEIEPAPGSYVKEKAPKP